MTEPDARKSWISTHGANISCRWRWEHLADVLAVAIAVSLPWSISLTTIFTGLWLIALLPILNIAGLRRVVASPAGGLPILFWLLALIGMLWASDVPMTERWGGLTSWFRFLVIPLLMFQFERSSRAPWVMNGFLLSCGTLLIFSWILIFVPTLPWPRNGGFGVPVKDYIAQTGEFAVCIFLLAGTALTAWQELRRGLAEADRSPIRTSTPNWRRFVTGFGHTAPTGCRTGKSALASPSCHAWTYGNTFPTNGQVIDALSEVGVNNKVAAGRWTLSD